MKEIFNSQRENFIFALLSADHNSAFEIPPLKLRKTELIYKLVMRPESG